MSSPELCLRPAYAQRASASVMKELIYSVLDARLSGQTYQGDQVQQQTKSIADDVKDRLKGLKLPRYKFMVQCVIGEQRGEGARMGCRTFWDRDTDTCASETFINDSIFCVVVAYAVYLC
ncbi:Tctex-1 [Pelagophyceae sp. CCMP2097]|nr:Tctex-1 [Pelagophyceae sp. CCMP2097]|mmetsp:Transcript_2888/g.8580  ORF Transcript_2888/g.8580 Transcript_2888/m.8580 type:complete len:120 (+) Transcript_2888:76-435(+)